MNSHPLLSELRDAALGTGDGVGVRAHLEVCLACRVRMARIAQHGGFEPAGPNVVRAVVEASEVVPGIAELVSATVDHEPAAGELWRVGDAEALLVWVRHNFGDGAVDVVPVVLDVALADEYAVVVPAADSPLPVELAVLVSLRVHVHRDAFIDCLGMLDVAGQVEGVTAALRDGRAAPTSSIVAFDSDDDERIEYRQAMRDLLAEWAPSAWLARTRTAPTPSEPHRNTQPEARTNVERMQDEVSARVDSALCSALPTDHVLFGDGLKMTALFKVDFLDTAVFVGSVESLDAAVVVQDALLSACERAIAWYPDTDAVCVVEVHDEWPCLLYTRASMRPGYELPAGRWVPPYPILNGLGLVDTLWKHLDGEEIAWEASERAPRKNGAAGVAETAGGHARDVIDRVRQQGRRAHQPAKKLAWSDLPDDLDVRVALFVSAVADDVPIGEALARLHGGSEA